MSIKTKMDENSCPEITPKPRKRPVLGNRKLFNKQKRLSGHVTGPNCNCSRFKCFENVDSTERQRIIDHFNSLPTKDEQDCYISSLITINPIKRKKSSNDKENSHPHEHSYQYIIRILRSDKLTTVPVCHKAFIASFGVTRKRVELIRDSIVKTGLSTT